MVPTKPSLYQVMPVTLKSLLQEIKKMRPKNPLSQARAKNPAKEAVQQRPQKILIRLPPPLKPPLQTIRPLNLLKSLKKQVMAKEMLPRSTVVTACPKPRATFGSLGELRPTRERPLLLALLLQKTLTLQFPWILPHQLPLRSLQTPIQAPQRLTHPLRVLPSLLPILTRPIHHPTPKMSNLPQKYRQNRRSTPWTRWKSQPAPNFRM